MGFCSGWAVNCRLAPGYDSQFCTTIRLPRPARPGICSQFCMSRLQVSVFELTVPCSDLAKLASHLLLLPASDTLCVSNSKSSAARSLGHGRRSRPAAATYGCMHVVPLGVLVSTYTLWVCSCTCAAPSWSLAAADECGRRDSPLATCSLRLQVALLHERERGPS